MKLKEARRILNVKQKDFAANIGARVETVSRWENEKRIPMGVYQEKIDAFIEKAKAKKVKDIFS
jgi:DNA-binding transcriptional regulator YiaG